MMVPVVVPVMVVVPMVMVPVVMMMPVHQHGLHTIDLVL